jgi:hypothetical protein
MIVTSCSVQEFSLLSTVVILFQSQIRMHVYLGYSLCCEEERDIEGKTSSALKSQAL